MKILSPIWWLLSPLIILFGLFWAFYGFLEFIGFGDGGTLPKDDLPIIVAGFLGVLFGALMIINLKTKFRRKYPVILFGIMSFTVAIYFTSISACTFFTEMNSQRDIIWIPILICLWHFPIVTTSQYRILKEHEV